MFSSDLVNSECRIVLPPKLNDAMHNNAKITGEETEKKCTPNKEQNNGFFGNQIELAIASLDFGLTLYVSEPRTFPDDSAS